MCERSLCWMAERVKINHLRVTSNVASPHHVMDTGYYCVLGAAIRVWVKRKRGSDILNIRVRGLIERDGSDLIDVVIRTQISCSMFGV